jgi:hypothetical protein
MHRRRLQLYLCTSSITLAIFDLAIEVLAARRFEVPLAGRSEGPTSILPVAS